MPLRFVHAANLRLDAPLSPPCAVADDVRAILEEATATAFERTVTAAIEQNADALIITGNTFDASANSLAADATLLRELARLDDAGMPVFITPGVLDPPSAWKEISFLPENVTVFLHGDEAGVELTDRGRPLATILPVSAKFGVDAPELEQLHALAGRRAEERGFTIGLWIPDPAGSRAPSTAGYSSLDYLAAAELSSSLPLTEGHVHLQPGPQGLDARETGWHGCRIVDVEKTGEIRSRLIPTAPVRWETCVVDGRGVTDRDELCERMLEQLEALAGYAGEMVRIITWPMDHALLESAGVHGDDEANDLQNALIELSDQPKRGLRYVHQIVTVWDDAHVPTAVDRELWQDFLMEMDRWTPLELDRVARLWEQQTGSASAPVGWPADVRWPPVNPEHVRRGALQNGRRWFRQTGGAAR
jgi:hypothetical protein